jgi:hypothetical protein
MRKIVVSKRHEKPYDEIIVSASCFAISRVIYEIAEYVKALIE